MAANNAYKFTAEDEQYILDNHKTLTIGEMARHLDISWETLSKKVKAMGLVAYTISDRWTDEDIEKLRSLAVNHSFEEIAEQLNRTTNSIVLKSRKLGIKVLVQNRRWTIEDIDYLRRNWGRIKLVTLAKTLHRSEEAVLQQGHKLKLGCLYHSSEDIPLSVFCKSTGISRDSIVNTYVVKYNFPLKSSKQGKLRLYYFVDIDSVTDWLYKHQSLFDASKFEPYFIIPEPDWLKAKREYDMKHKDKINYQLKKRVWTQDEEVKLKYYIEIGRSFEEIALELNRSEKAVQARASKIGLGYKSKTFWRGKDFKYLNEHWQTQTDKEIAKAINRPVRSVSEHRASLGLVKPKYNEWKPYEVEYLKNNWETMTDREIGKKLGRTELAVKQKRFRLGLKHKI